MTQPFDKRWLALIILCLGDLMIVLDMTVVNVALPSIRTDLNFSETSLVWVINAYMLTFSGFLLLGGRLGDLFGNRRMFLFGIALFTFASLLCGIAVSQWMLVGARALQGLGGAIFSAVALAIVINLFTDPQERAQAMGFWGFVAAGGGAIGVLVGGLLTGIFDWHWIFLVNIPVGLGIFLLCFYLLPNSPGIGMAQLDILGAITITISLLLAVYAIVNSNAVGWLSLQTLGILLAATLLFALFLYIESKVRAPLVPLRIFKTANITTVSGIGILWSVAMFAWFFMTALYLQLVLRYTPMEVGLAFLPPNLIMAAFSWGLSAKMVLRFGTKLPIVFGMSLIAVGLLLFTYAPINADFSLHVLPGMLLIGLGAGVTFNPVLLAGMGDILCNHTGILDWKYATAKGHCEVKWPYDEAMARLSNEKVEAVLNHRNDIRDLTDKGIDVLIDGLRHGSTYHGSGWNPRQIEGFDHFFYYSLEKLMGKKFIHGQPVSLGVYIGSLLHNSRAEEMLTCMHDIGLDIRPEAMGVTWKDAAQALFNLQDYVRQNDLWHSIAHDTKITPSFVETVKQSIETVYGVWR